jgi:hypothetical protein
MITIIWVVIVTWEIAIESRRRQRELNPGSGIRLGRP